MGSKNLQIESNCGSWANRHDACRGFDRPRLISYRVPHGSANGSARNRPRQRKATLESNLPDSISELARFEGTEIRSRPAAAHPRHSHAAAAAINAGTSQFLCNRTNPESRREGAASKKNRGARCKCAANLPERRIPPAKQTTGQSEGSFMCAVSAAPTPPYDMFVGKCQTN
jgi:hypothetical protein